MRRVTASARADTGKNVPKHLRLPCIESAVVALGRESQHPLLQGRSISSRHVPAGNMTIREAALLAFQLSPRQRKHNLPDRLRVRPGSDRNGIA